MQDMYGEVINSKETYEYIAEFLKGYNPVFIGWTDQLATHYDILFTYGAIETYGNHQRGLNNKDLFISIMGRNAHGFSIDKTKHPGYIMEKLYLEDNSTSRKIAELINGVIKELGGESDEEGV